MQANPALLAALFITSVTSTDVPMTDEQPAHTRVDVGLSDGSTHLFVCFVAKNENGDDQPLVHRVVLADGREMVEGPIVTEQHRAMFAVAKTVEFPDMTPPAPVAPAGPTEAEIAEHAAVVQAANDAAAAAEAARLAALVPPIAPDAPPLVAVENDSIPTDQHYARLAALVQVVEQQLPSGFLWAAREMRAIHEDLYPRTAE